MGQGTRQENPKKLHNWSVNAADLLYLGDLLQADNEFVEDLGILDIQHKLNISGLDKYNNTTIADYSDNHPYWGEASKYNDLISNFVCDEEFNEWNGKMYDF